MLSPISKMSLTLSLLWGGWAAPACAHDVYGFSHVTFTITPGYVAPSPYHVSPVVPVIVRSAPVVVQSVPVAVYPQPVQVLHPYYYPTAVTYARPLHAGTYSPYYARERYSMRPGKFEYKYKVYSPYRLGSVYEYEYENKNGRIEIEEDFD